jgi:hypothetical protein
MAKNLKDESLDEEHIRHKKKKRKFVIISNHKHQYAQCLFRVKDSKNVSPLTLFGGDYCTICGKIRDKMIGGRIINDNHLPVFEIDDYFQKYVEGIGEN